MKSLNKIFKTFRKTLADLDKYVDQVNEHIDKNEEKLADIESDNIRSRWEREKAANARTKIADLIGEG